MPNVVEYIDDEGNNRYRDQYNQIADAKGRAQITAASYKMRYGNLKNVDTCGDGVYEFRILAKGPGYRVYFGKEGDHMMVLLGVGTKRSQKKDIVATKVVWKTYQATKQESQRK